MKKDGRMLLELLVVLPMLGILGMVLCGLFMTQARVARLARERARSAETVRMTAGVLRSELRWVDPDSDVHAWVADSLRLRSFRGLAVTCGRLSQPVLVAFSGLRQADPSKDSVLLIGHGQQTVHALQAVRDTVAGCSRGLGPSQLWSLAPPAAMEGILLAFETGTYSVSDGALRYRVGMSGRQPITDELIDSRASRFESFGLRLSLVPPASSAHLLRFRPLNGH
jgi:hypothetical protein